MASPRPIAVVMFSAKTETSVSSERMRSTRNVPTTDSAPITSGSAADTTLPNTSSSRMIVIGMAIISAREEIVFDRRADLAEHGAEAANLHVDDLVVERVERGHELVGDVVDLVVAALDPSEHERLVATFAAQRRVLTEGPVREDVGEARVAEPLREPVTGELGRGVVDVPGLGGDEQDQVRRCRAELVEQRGVGLERLGVGVVEPARRQVFGDPAADAARDDEQRGGSDEHDAAATDDGVCEGREHVAHWTMVRPGVSR